MATDLKVLLTILLLCVSLGVAAEPLPDPTRPPAEFFTSIDAASGVKGAPTDEGLRTIIISSDQRSAVINGHLIPLGGKVDEERLMAVCEDSVVLQGVEGRREVLLYPGVDIHGRKAVRCNTTEIKKPLEATSVSRKKSSKKRHKVSDGVTGK